MNNAELKARLQGIVDMRAARLPEVEVRLSQLDALDLALEGLRAAARELPADWAEQDAIRDSLARIDDSDASGRLAEARAILQSVRARLSRSTVNVGVAGRARVGKSTLLQSVSGLSDDQVPTGEDVNVTAVRSRLFHASSPTAFLSFHTRQSFLDDVVRPYFTELLISPMPPSLDAFERVDLSAMLEERRSAQERLTHNAETRWQRLIEIQKAIPGIRHLLEQGELTLTDLEGLRPYVAYPTAAQTKREIEDGKPAPRQYLAVRDCRIETPFPETSVDRLGIVDLPGLGEAASGIDERIVAGLRDEVDVVLLMKRAAVGLSNVDETDSKAADLIDLARGDILDTKDFAWVVINASPGDESRVDALRIQILNKLNFNLADSRYVALQADARDAKQVHENVLVPVLERLAARLPDMDGQVLQGAVRSLRGPLLSIQASATSMQDAVGRARSTMGRPREELDDLAHDLRADLSQSLKQLRPDRLSEDYVERYVMEIETIHQGVRDWLKDGLGRFDSEQAWLEYALREGNTEASLRPFAIAELHRLRVEITGRYAQLDTYLNNVLVEEFYAEVCERFDAGTEEKGGKSRAELAVLLGSATQPPSARIQELLDNLEACDPPVPGLVRAVRRLAGLRFDFRLQSYPVLHELSLRRRPRDGKYPPDFPNVETMYNWYTDEAVQYSYDIRRALEKDAERQFTVLSGAAVVFEDEIIRSGTAKAEIRALADGYRDEFWPGKFNDLNSLSAKARAFSDAVTEVRRAVNGALETSHE